MNALNPNYLVTRSPYRSHHQNNPIFGAVPNITCPSSPVGELAADQTATSNFPYQDTQGALHYRVNGGSYDVDYNAPNNSSYPGFSTSGILYPKSKTRFGDIIDGTTNTILAGETSSTKGWPTSPSNMITGFGGHKPWVWGFYRYSGPDWLMIDHKMVQYPINYSGSFGTNSTPFSSYHPGGALFVMCDGSVTFLPETLSLDLLKAYATRKNGEVHSGL